MTSPDVFTFTTPDLAPRDPQTITVNLAGEELTIDRPKDWTLANVDTAFANDVPDDVRAPAILRYLSGVLGPDGFKHLMSRSLDRDDPLNLDGVLWFVVETYDRWTNFDPRRNPPITITDRPTLLGQRVPVRNPDLDIDTTVTPPKRLFLLFLYGYGATPGGAGYAMEYAMEAVFPRDVFLALSRRLNTPDDVLDIGHLTPMITRLVDAWSSGIELKLPPVNREGRRAAQREQDKQGRTTRTGTITDDGNGEDWAPTL